MADIELLRNEWDEAFAAEHSAEFELRRVIENTIAAKIRRLLAEC